MSDSVVTVATIGYGSRLKESIKAVLVGVVLFFASFGVLWWNEGDIVAEKQALAELEKATVEGNVTKPLPKNDNKPVHSTGKLASQSMLSDEQFLMPGAYLRLSRDVEMYQWVETKDTKSTSNAGGSETKETTYSYSKEWHEGRVDSSKFQRREGHANPPLKYEANVWTVESASYGEYDGMSVLENHQDLRPIKLSAKILTPAATTAGAEIREGKLYIKIPGKSIASNESEIGDVRISYRATSPGEVSVIAVQSESRTLSAFVGSNGKEKFLVEVGKKPATAMIGTARDNAKFTAMILRGVGFLMMWIGMCLIAGPFAVLLDVIPIFGTVTRSVVGGISFIISAVLTIVTIAVAMVAHNPMALAVVVAAVVVGGVFFFKKKVDSKAGKAGKAAGGAESPLAQDRAA